MSFSEDGSVDFTLESESSILYYTGFQETRHSLFIVLWGSWQIFCIYLSSHCLQRRLFLAPSFILWIYKSPISLPKSVQLSVLFG